MDVSTIALALGSSLAAGLNLYLTVLALGLLQRFEVLSLPESMQALSHPWVLIAAGVLFLIEFVADKVPYIDNSWDAIHSFIRVPAGAILAASAFGDLPSHWIWLIALLGGFVSFSAHGAKASTRLAVNLAGYEPSLSRRRSPTGPDRLFYRSAGSLLQIPQDALPESPACLIFQVTDSTGNRRYEVSGFSCRFLRGEQETMFKNR